MLVCSCSLGALAYKEPYMNENGSDCLNPDNGYSEVTQNDSESTYDTDIAESADTVETDFDEVEKEILRKVVSQLYEERAERKKSIRER